MKKKLIALMLVGILSCTTIACSDNSSTQKEEVETTSEITEQEKPSSDAESADDDLDDLDALGDVEVEKELFDVNLTIPAEYVGETTQEELDASAAELGYKVVLNEDGSATYTMTKSQHREFLENLRTEFNAALNEIAASEEYPNINEITANDNFTSFTVTTLSTELDMMESFSVLAFYMYGGMYNLFSGETIDNVHVDFVNAETGEIISSSDSADMATE